MVGQMKGKRYRPPAPRYDDIYFEGVRQLDRIAEGEEKAMIPAVISGLLTAAPALARLIGGSKAGKAADAVVGIAEAITGQTGADAVKAIQKDPALALEFERAVMAQEAEILRLSHEDRKDARARDVELRRIGYSNWRADILAIGAMIGLVALIWTLLFVSIPDGPARDVLLILSGALVTIVKDVYQFEFGSSRGSKEKDRLG